MSYSAQEKYDEAMREVKMRLRVYPGWIDAGKLTVLTAERRIAIMQEIAEEYKNQIESERLV